MLSSMLFVISVLLGSAVQLLGQPQPVQLVGCLSQVPNGGVQFQANPSGTTYFLQGNGSALTQHLNQIVSITGSSAGKENGNQAPTFVVQTIDVVHQSCTAPLHGKPVAVVGKAGEGQVAIPVTTSKSTGQTTPGFQTETVLAQAPPNNGRSVPLSAQMPKLSYSPGNTAQANQSAVGADLYAQAATRSEIQPGSTLGANLPPATVSVGRTVVYPAMVELRGDQKQEFSPARVTIKVGGAVQWKNTSNLLLEISDNPNKIKEASSTASPAGSRPFDSGFIRPGATFTQTFSVPGTYHYFCFFNCSGTVTGEVLVQP